MVAASAIILLVSIAKGVQADVTNQVKSLGVNILVVIPGRVDLSGFSFNPNLGGQSFLKETDAESVLPVAGVVRSTPLTFAGGGVRFGKNEAYPITIATTSNWFLMRPVPLKEGDFWTDPKESGAVCVIGSIAAEALFGAKSGLGKEVEVNKRKYRVIGVTVDKAAGESLFSMGSFENVVYLPYHGLKKLQPDMQTDRLMIQTAPESEPKTLVKSIDQILAKRLDKQQYTVLTQEDLLGVVYKLMSILTWLLTGLTSIALFVGGVGIMAVMLMSVGERTKEIGVRKTVGARRSDVFVQFLIEAILISLGGGLVGFAFSAGVCWALATYTPIKPMITGDVIALAFGVSVGVGAIFGLLPAIQAARRDPVVALRNGE